MNSKAKAQPGGILAGSGKSRSGGKKLTSGAEARQILNDLTARVNSCPSQTQLESVVFPQHARACLETQGLDLLFRFIAEPVSDLMPDDSFHFGAQVSS